VRETTACRVKRVVDSNIKTLGALVCNYDLIARHFDTQTHVVTATLSAPTYGRNNDVTCKDAFVVASQSICVLENGLPKGSGFWNTSIGNLDRNFHLFPPSSVDGDRT
jgi:hypothetical protein